jgi:hypothetical protein
MNLYYNIQMIKSKTQKTGEFNILFSNEDVNHVK